VSVELAAKLELGLAELAALREQIAELLSLPRPERPDVIERSAACAMLHSFYTEIEKLLKLIPREWEGGCLDRMHGTRSFLYRCRKRRRNAAL